MESKIKPVNTIKRLLSRVPLVMVVLGDFLTYGEMVDRRYRFMAEAIMEVLL